MLAVVLIAYGTILLASETPKTTTSDTTKTAETKSNKVYTEDKPNILVSSAYPDFSIKLKSNPTTGFTWFLREYDANLITPTKHSFIKPEQNLMGAPGYEVWQFHVKPAAFAVPHQTNIRMVYARPWQSDSSTQVVFRVSTVGK